jgi:hypothetical protein
LCHNLIKHIGRLGVRWRCNNQCRGSESDRADEAMPRHHHCLPPEVGGTFPSGGKVRLGPGGGAAGGDGAGQFSVTLACTVALVTM